MEDPDVLWSPRSERIPFMVRKALPSDIPFITNSWLKSYRSAPSERDIPNNQYYWCQHKLIEALVPRSAILVAALKEDPKIIMGWICAEVTDAAVLTHYVYVKQDYRLMGIGEALVRFVNEYEQPPAFISTHLTKVTKKFMNKVVSRINEGSDRNIAYFHNRYYAFDHLPDGWLHAENQTAA